MYFSRPALAGQRADLPPLDLRKQSVPNLTQAQPKGLHALRGTLWDCLVKGT